MGTRKEAITQYCPSHPTEVIVGVCALCVNEKLLILASEQAHRNLIKSIHEAHEGLPKAFAFGSFPQNHLNLMTKSSDDARRNAFSGNEEVFISIKFGDDDGNRLWNKCTSSRPCLEICNPTSTYCFNKARRGSMSIVEHSRPTRTIWWRKGVDHLFKNMLGKIQV
ncbi:uncharacterized protein LOC122085158 [Macadamia integrifolia]|uniref:uncharacterized protein LOC122085158 n=1 Tax=Macadamia integrifolia TaxID=60698 RepID=UPI001C4EAE35|nr:uncharacterized protein LOC122085158 [Macadamia integrifolia]